MVSGYGYLSVPGRPINLDRIVGQGCIVLALGAGGAFRIFFLAYTFSFPPPTLRKNLQTMS